MAWNSLLIGPEDAKRLENRRPPKSVEKTQCGKVKERLSHLAWKTLRVSHFPTASTSAISVYLFTRESRSRLERYVVVGDFG